MKDIFRRITKQETYLGEKKKKYYFEGWYYKFITNDKKTTIAIICGVTKGIDAHSFIQVIDNIKNQSYYFRYDLTEFSFCNEPFSIKIGDNRFSLTEVSFNIKEISLKGKLTFRSLRPIHKTLYSPNIMGPFAYLPFLECNHSVISLGHFMSGKLGIYNRKINFNRGTCYIEKDYGVSFPKKYVWMQGTSEHQDTSIFFSLATIPFKVFTFDGLIGIILIQGREYRFSTYQGAKMVDFKKVEDNTYLIQIKQGQLLLEINLKSGEEITLVSPSKGRMNEHVKESLASTIHVRLFQDEELFFEEEFTPCTTEMLWD